MPPDSDRCGVGTRSAFRAVVEHRAASAGTLAGQELATMSPTDPDVVCPTSTHPRRADEAARLERLLRRAHTVHGRQREQLLDEAILAGIPLARTLARRYHGRGVDNEDL